MANRTGGVSTRRHIGRWAVIGAIVLSAVVAWSPAPAGAEVAASGLRCFGVAGSPGDAAIVNLTPILAATAGDGQLVASDVRNDLPTAANVNFGPGTIDPNVAVTPVGSDGRVCFANSVHGSVDLVADHLGGIAGDRYRPAQPSGAPDRKLDTRRDAVVHDRCATTTAEGRCSGWTSAPAAVEPIAPSGRLCFAVAGAPGDAAIVNLTPVAATAAGDGQLVSSDVKDDPPVAANVNFGPGTVDPNVAVARIGADGQVCFVNSRHASLHLVADHLGTIAGSAFTPARADGAPDRRVDTRYDDDVVHADCTVPLADDFRIDTAEMMLGLAHRAYRIDPGSGSDGDRLDTIAPPVDYVPARMHCWELVTAFRTSSTALGGLTDTEVLIARNAETHDLAVAFRGTEADLSDIINDADVRRTSWELPNGQVLADAAHRGFAAAYRSARDQVLAVLAREANPEVPDARVYFTGHSLGGALATLASLDLVDDLIALGYARSEVVTYTFGAPRSMSLQLANEHATLVPSSFAVANPYDPVPHVPSAIGTDPYSHMAQMIVVHGEQSSSLVRFDPGDGRHYRGCGVYLVPKLGDHDRGEYGRRIASDDRLGTPTIGLVIAGGEFRMIWNSRLEGPCDEAALYHLDRTPTPNDTPIRDRYVALDTNDQHTTTVGKGDGYHAAYRNMFGDLLDIDQYVPATPTVSLRRNDNGLYPDTIDFVWSVPDPGDHDLVVLFDANPWVVGPNGYYVSPVGRVEAKANTDSPERTAIWVGSDADKWYVAYVMIDDDGRQRILATSRGVRG